MRTLTKRQRGIVEEVIWLAEAANDSRPSKYGEINITDKATIEEAFVEAVPQRTLKRFIDNLRSKQKIMLQAVLSVGTGERSARDFPALLDRFERDFEDAAQYICGKDRIGKKLLCGLKKLKDEDEE